jgi:hypothetical protein
VMMTKMILPMMTMIVVVMMSGQKTTPGLLIAHCSIVPLSIIPRSDCHIIQLSHCSLLHCPIVDYPTVRLSHYPIVR